MKYFDDSTAAVSINLKQLLIPDPIERSKPLNWCEKSGLVLPKNMNYLQDMLNEFLQFAWDNNLKINQKKSKVIFFNFSQKFTFSPEISLGQEKNT